MALRLVGAGPFCYWLIAVSARFASRDSRGGCLYVSCGDGFKIKIKIKIKGSRTGVSDPHERGECLEAVEVVPAFAGSFDCVAAPLRGAATTLRMTDRFSVLPWLAR
jgi:hypothetical protein